MNQLASDTMKIQLASDLHLEFLQREHPGERLITPAPDADVLVLAGDIANGTDAIRLFADWPVPVLYLAGNHEFYGLCMENTRRELRAASRGSNVRFLDEEAVELGGVRFLGATLWTDYDLDGRPAQAAVMRMCERRLMDHSAIRTRRGTFEAADAWQEHQSSRSWLQVKLAERFAGATVVISHHGPHRNSVHPRYAGDPVNGGSSATSRCCWRRHRCGCTVTSTTVAPIALAVAGWWSIRAGTSSPGTRRWIAASGSSKTRPSRMPASFNSRSGAHEGQ